MTEELDPISRRLESERPVPSAGFRGELRRRLVTAADARRSAPPGLRLLIAAWAGSGAVLLAIAVIGLTGIGPLAA
jgi:hypothetical protein